MDSTPAPDSGAATPPKRRDLVPVVTIVLVVALIAGGLLWWWSARWHISGFGAYAGNTTQGASTFHLWQGFTIAAVIVGGFVTLLMVWAIFRYRATGDKIPRQTQYHLPLEITYTIVPILIVIGLFVATVVVENKVTADPKPAVTINATAFQWGWQFLYPGTNALVVGQTTSEPMFEIPLGETVQFHLNATDVTHGFYIRSFNFSRLAIPGIDNEYSFYATKPGIFFGQCDELCGYLHAYMWFRVDVVTKAQYAKWIASFNTVAGAKAAEAAALATQHGLSSGVPTKPTGNSGL